MNRLPLSRSERYALEVILGIAIVVRVLVCVELSRTSAFHLQRWAHSDMHFFYVWARAIAEGDLLSRDVGHPLHEWHLEIATRYFAMFPDEATGEPPQEASRRIWRTWYGGPRFHQEPLYPYLLSLVLSMGGDVGVVFAGQALLGVGIVALLWATTRRAFGVAPALAAAAAAAVCAPLVFFETVLLRPTLVTAIGLLLVYVAGKALASQTDVGLRWWWVTGAVLGASLLVRSIFALYGLGLLVWLVWRRRKGALRAVAAVVVGASICLLPVLVRNLIVGAPPMSLSSVNAITFLNSNTVDYDPSGGFAVSMEHAPSILAETKGRGLETIAATLRTHSGWQSVLSLVAGKTWSMIHGWEKPNNVSLYFHRRLSRTLRMLPVTFTAVFPLAVVGLIWRGRSSRAIPLLLLVGTFLVTLLVSYVLARFRLPLLAALIPFAAVGGVELAGRVRARQWSSVAAALGTIVIVSAAVRRPHPEIRYADYAAAFEVYYGRLAVEASRRGDLDGQKAALDEFLALEPKSFANSPEEQELKANFASIRIFRSRLGE